MNIGTHYDYNNHITFISTHIKMGTPHADSVFSNIAANFCQCLSLIVSKLSTWDKAKI